MPLGRQAKTLSRSQVSAVLNLITQTRHPIRNRVILLLSVRAGLRAKEIAQVTWTMTTDADGNISEAIKLRDSASKGRSGRVVPLHAELRAALVDLHVHDRP